MATIASTLMTGTGQRTVTTTTLTASDTFTYVEGSGQILILRNGTGGPLSPVIDGAAGTTVQVAGIGAVDVSGGYAVDAIADGVTKAIPLDTIKEYLRGTIAVTGGTGIVASILKFS
jgi:phage FluMu protein gp41